MAYGRRGSLYMDPSFQAGLELGNAYGNMWAANAKNRQGEHAKDILEEMRQQQQIEEIANMNKLQEGPKEPQKAVSVTGNIPGYNGFSLSSATPDGRSVQENAIDEVLGLKSGGQYPIGQQEAADEKNVAAASDLQKVNLGFNPNFSVDEFKRRANERGLNKEVIDMYLPDVQKEAAEQARNNLLPEIMDGLYGYTNEKGEYAAPTPESYRNANEKLMLLKMYDPDTANPLLSGSITPRDIYNENRQNTVYSRTRQDLLTDRAEARSNKKQDAQESIALKREAEKQQFLDHVTLWMEVYGVDYKTAAKLALGGSGTGRGKGGSGLPGSVSTQQMNAAKEEINAFNDWKAMNPDIDVTKYPRYNQVNYAYQINDAALGYGGNSGGNGNAVEEIDWNNYNHDIRAVQQLKEEGYSDKDISTILLQNMGAGDLYNNVVKDRNLPNLARNAQQNDTDAAIAAIAAQSSKGMFDDQDNERAGLVKALSDGLTVKQYLDNKYGNK